MGHGASWLLEQRYLSVPRGNRNGRAHLAQGNAVNDGLVYGKIKLRYNVGKEVSILPNEYNFERGARENRPWMKDAKGFLRNVFTMLGGLNASMYGGKDYMINFTGTATLRALPKEPSKSTYKPYRPYY